MAAVTLPAGTILFRAGTIFTMRTPRVIPLKTNRWRQT